MCYVFSKAASLSGIKPTAKEYKTKFWKSDVFMLRWNTGKALR